MTTKNNFFIPNTIESLKKRLNTSSQLTIQNEEGNISHVEFKFNPPKKQDEISIFENISSWLIPEDLKTFLLIHNGAILFNDIECGGGIEILSLEDYKEQHLDYMPSTWYPIAYYHGDCLLVDSDRCRAGRNDYLVYHESCTSVEDAKYLNLNFEIWLDRIIIAQGAKYWTWSLYNALNYYSTR
ncbi:SMI1/KNR4 family protein [Caldalkalibacillus mannanilyticus]|uniref:SMI1/KNR4 family protein n=1 Tax=Caldalkalibacillus mannanilyticus TaxID=1418 RepID=UPI0004687F33|nr:SMI1/KNR4 family protein [Caldalkalibacillus mannanilyticus]